MTIIAVTGGIGAGKSTVSRMLADCGAVIIDSDQLAREVVAPGSVGLTEIAAAFGDHLLRDDGSLDRAALATVVFTDSAARERLEAITHPKIRAEFDRRLAEARAADPRAVIVNDIPLVRTAADAARYDLVVTIVADHEVRLARLVARGLTADDARARIAAQISDADRAELADIVINNDGDETHLRAEVDRLWRERLAPR